MRTSFIFGNIATTTRTLLGEGGNFSNFTTAYHSRESFSDFTLQGAAGYTTKLNDKTRLNIGATYDISNNIRGQELGELERQSLTGGQGNVKETIIDRDGSIRLPSILNGGFSFQRINKWTLGTELRIQNWSQYRGFNGATENLQNSVRVAVGGEFIPDISSVDNYFKRLTYRMGLHLEKTPFEINGQQVNDFGINFGTSLPVWGFSSLNLAVGVGQRGSIGANSISDQYVKIFFGITFNDKPWIKLPKYD
jgi:hypothetical protein